MGRELPHARVRVGWWQRDISEKGPHAKVRLGLQGRRWRLGRELLNPRVRVGR